MDKDAKTSEVIRSTPGVRLVLALAWRGMLGEDDHQVLDRPGTLLAISEAAAIATDDTNVGGSFDELVAAAGGRVTDLASMVVQHFSRAHSARKSQATALFLLSCINILDEHTDPTRSLCNALQSICFVAILVPIIFTVHDTAAESIISDCAQNVLIACLEYRMKMPKAPLDIALAIESGLLQLAVVIAASIKGVTDGKHAIIQRMFDKVLIPSLVHYAVVVQLQKCFPEAVAVAARYTIGKSPFAAMEKSFDFDKVAVGFLDSWEAKARPSFKACDNLIVSPLRSSLFSHSMFASAEKSHQDTTSSAVPLVEPWTIVPRSVSLRIGVLGIKTCAKAWRALNLGDPRQSPHAVGIVLAYNLMLDICSRKVHFMYEHPDQQAVTVFNYSSTDGVEIKVGRSSDLESFDPASEILHQFPRESRSGGRMGLHVMATLEGGTSRLHLFPVRTSTAKLHHRLVAVAQGIREIPRSTPRAEFLH
ncbi:hypothetical protein B0H19DRAFT_1252521 [Mycena capillaripes]|nr:hypothetical protein B0H19DRAFT_1252521 [Mycena capillaripes]